MELPARSRFEGRPFSRILAAARGDCGCVVDGWFKSGDIAIRENNIYRILGRDSVDIIKTGGFKVSALEIEEELRTHDLIEECAVVKSKMRNGASESPPLSR